MRSRDYWKRRAELLEGARHREAGRYTREIERLFNLAQKTLTEQIEQWYARFAKNNEITMSEARQWLKGKDLAEFKWDVHEYIRRGKENAVNGQWMKQLENASARFHISKLEALKLKTRATVEQLYGRTMGNTRSFFGDVYRESYYHTAFEIQKGFSTAWDIASPSVKQIESVLSKPWTLDNRTFSDRIWQHKQGLLSEVHTQLSQNMILGRAPDKSINAIAKKFETSKSNAGRLIMTESAYFAGDAQRRAYETLGVDEFEFLCALDELTCPVCGAMDGRHFPTSQAEPGVNVEPLHPRCRCTTVPYFADDHGSRIARDAKTKKQYYVPQDMKYSEWKEKYVTTA